MDPNAHWNKQLYDPEDLWGGDLFKRGTEGGKYIVGLVLDQQARGPGVSLRQFAEHPNDDLIEHFFGYESPYLERKPFHVTDIGAWSSENIDNCKWDQIDVRKYFFHLHMTQQSWEQYADGVWYHDDYMQFLDLKKFKCR